MSLLDWTKSETISPPDTITISWTTDATQTQAATKRVQTLSSSTKSTSTTSYTTLSYIDSDGNEKTQDVAVYKEDIKTTTKASANQSWITDRLKRNRGLPSGDDTERSVTKYEYVTSVDGPKLVKETTEVYISMAAFAGQMQGIPYSFTDPESTMLTDYLYYDPPDEEVLAHRTIVEHEEAKTVDGRTYTRTRTSRWIALGQVTESKEALLAFIKAVKGIGLLTLDIITSSLDKHTSLKFEGTEVQVNIGRAPVPAKPSDAELAASEVTNGSDIPSDATPTDVYGNDVGWTSYVPDNVDWKTLTGDSNGDGVPDWAPYVPDQWQDYDQDSNGDGVPDWAPYVPGDWQDYVTDPGDWQNTAIDSNNDGVPDWAEEVPVGWEDFNTSDTEYTNPDPEVSNERLILGRVVFDGQNYNDGDPTVTATYEMPFAPDDYFYYDKRIRKLARGNATAAAIKFGATEAALDIGHAFGQNIVTSFDLTPSLDLAPVYVRIAGIEGAFLMDAASYAWGAEGMVVSTDLMLIGVTGYEGASPPSASWLRLPVAPSTIGQAGATTLESNPSKANSIALPGSFNPRNPGAVLASLPYTGVDVFREWRANAPVVPPSLVVDKLSISTGPTIKLKEYSYGLTLDEEVAELSTGPVSELEWLTQVVIPSAEVLVAALAPSISTGARVSVPAAATQLAALDPLVVSGASVAVPAAAVNVAAVAPDMVGRLRKEVLTPAADLTMAALVPGVSSGGSIAVPAVGVAIAGMVPTQVGTDRDSSFSSVSLLLHMNGSDGSTTFTDNSSNAFALTRSGNTRISTAQSKFGGSSGLFDGDADWLSVANSTAYQFGTGDFTIEAWVYTLSQQNSFSSIVGSGVGTFSTGAVFLMNYGVSVTTTLIRKIGFGTPASNPTVLSTTVINTGAWYHVAVTRNSSTVRLFINGSLEATAVNNESINLSASGLQIGRNGWDGAQGYWNGYIDELRITKGVARYIASFTPPTAQYPDR